MNSKLDKVQTAHAIVESLATETMEYENLLNDYDDYTMMEQAGLVIRSEWEQTWRDKFNHHVSALNKVTYLLKEFLKCEDNIDASENGSKEVVDSTENGLSGLSEQNRHRALEIAESFSSELPECNRLKAISITEETLSVLECKFELEAECSCFLCEDPREDIFTRLKDVISLLKNESMTPEFVARNANYRGCYGDNGCQGSDMQLFFDVLEESAKGLVYLDKYESFVDAEIVYIIHQSDGPENFSTISPEELVYSLCPEEYDLLLSSQVFEECNDEMYIYLKCEHPELLKEFYDSFKKPVRGDARVAVFEVIEDDIGWNPLYEKSYLAHPKGEVVYALMSEYQYFSEFKDKPLRSTNIKAYTLLSLERLFKQRLLDGERGSSELPRLNISSGFCDVIDNAMNFGIDTPCNKSLGFVGFLDGDMKFVDVLKERSMK